MFGSCFRTLVVILVSDFFYLFSSFFFFSILSLYFDIFYLDVRDILAFSEKTCFENSGPFKHF